MNNSIKVLFGGKQIGSIGVLAFREVAHSEPSYDDEFTDAFVVLRQENGHLIVFFPRMKRHEKYNDIIILGQDRSTERKFKPCKQCQKMGDDEPEIRVGVRWDNDYCSADIQKYNSTFRQA